MSPFEKLTHYAKTDNVVAIAKRVVDDDKSFGFSESEFSSLIMAAAKRDAKPGESPAQSFSRMYSAQTEDGAALRRAMSIIKASSPTGGYPFPRI